MSYDLDQRRRRERLEEMRQEEQTDNLLTVGVIAILASIAGAAFMLATVAVGVLALFMSGFTLASFAPQIPTAAPTPSVELALPAIENATTPTSPPPEVTAVPAPAIVTVAATVIATEVQPPIVQPTIAATLPPEFPPGWDSEPTSGEQPISQPTPGIDAGAATAIALATASAALLQPAATIVPTESPTVTPPLPENVVTPAAQSLMDDRGLPYQVESSPLLVVSQVRSVDAFGNLQVEANVTNAGAETYSLVDVEITLYDGQGNVVDVAAGVVQKAPFAPGDTSNFMIPSSVPTTLVTTYQLRLETIQ